MMETAKQILRFLWQCGEPYNRRNNLVRLDILQALTNGQYVIGSDGNDIRFFVCYWMVRPEDVDSIAHGEVPSTVTDGTVLYIAEFGNKDGLKGLLEMKRRLQTKVGNCNGVFWHRYGKGLKIFPNVRITEGVRK